jgi:MFS family permease
LGNASFAPIWAMLSDIWGRKAILLCVVAGFFCSSIVCALSIDMTMLIVGRAVQGAFGGGVGNLISIVISDLFSMRHRSLYMGLFELAWSVAGGVGPLLGRYFCAALIMALDLADHAPTLRSSAWAADFRTRRAQSAHEHG